MNKPATKHHQLTEHYLVPTTLFALNICVVHVIYAYATGSWHNYWHLAALAGSPVVLGIALLLKNRGLLACSTVGYLALLLCWP